MEVQGGVQQLEPHPLDSPRSGANQQSDFDDRQTDDSSRPSADNHSKDVQPASQTDDKKVSRSLPLLHRVCLNVCDDWWDPASLLSYSGRYGLHFYIEGRPHSQSYILLISKVAMHFACFMWLKHATWCGGHDNCRKVWVIQCWKNLFAHQCCKKKWNSMYFWFVASAVSKEVGNMLLCCYENHSAHTTNQSYDAYI